MRKQYLIRSFEKDLMASSLSAHAFATDCRYQRSSLHIPRHRKKHRGAAADRTFSPHLAVMTLDDAFDRGEADAGAVEFVGGVQSLEGRE